MIQLIDKIVDTDIRKKAVQRFREQGIILPTFKQMRNPDLVPEIIQSKLKHIGLWDRDPLNLFRIMDMKRICRSAAVVDAIQWETCSGAGYFHCGRRQCSGDGPGG